MRNEARFLSMGQLCCCLVLAIVTGVGCGDDGDGTGGMSGEGGAAGTGGAAGMAGTGGVSGTGGGGPSGCDLPDVPGEPQLAAQLVADATSVPLGGSITVTTQVNDTATAIANIQSDGAGPLGGSSFVAPDEDGNVSIDVTTTAVGMGYLTILLTVEPDDTNSATLYSPFLSTGGSTDNLSKRVSIDGMSEPVVSTSCRSFAVEVTEN